MTAAQRGANKNTIIKQP